MVHPHAGTSSCECSCHQLALQLVENIVPRADTFALEVECSECDCSEVFGVEMGAGVIGSRLRVVPPAPRRSREPGASFFQDPPRT